MKTITKKSKPKKTSENKPLAVGFNSKKIFLLFKDEDSLHISYADKDFKFDSKSFKVKIIDSNKKLEDIHRCHDFKFSESGGQIIMTYVRVTEKTSVLIYASSKDLKTWKIDHVLNKIHTAGVVVSNKKINTHIYFGNQTLKIAKEKISKTSKKNFS
jgi:predicted GH43/DUF377 family glycosyl hydrolase